MIPFIIDGSTIYRPSNDSYKASQRSWADHGDSLVANDDKNAQSQPHNRLSLRAPAASTKGGKTCRLANNLACHQPSANDRCQQGVQLRR